MNWRAIFVRFSVIPGRAEGVDPESILPVVVMDSGFAASQRPGMTPRKWLDAK
jgi:hypothetical protein